MFAGNKKRLELGEAPWSYGERWGLTIQATLGVGSNPSFIQKLDGNDIPIDGRKTNENNKDSQMGQVRSKKYFKTI